MAAEPESSWFQLSYRLALGMFARRAMASEQDAEDLARLDLEKLVHMPVEFVSGVSKYQEAIRHAPASVTVFNATDIRDYVWRTLADALRATPVWHSREIALSVYNLADACWSDPKNTGQITNSPRIAILRLARDF